MGIEPKMLVSNEYGSETLLPSLEVLQSLWQVDSLPASAMPIIYIKGIKPPCKPYQVVPLVLLGERDIQRLITAIYDSPSEFTNFQIQIPII